MHDTCHLLEKDAVLSLDLCISVLEQLLLLGLLIQVTETRRAAEIDLWLDIAQLAQMDLAVLLLPLFGEKLVPNRHASVHFPI